MLLLEQDTPRKKQVDDNVIKLEFDISNSEEYKVEAIWDNAIYAIKLGSNHLLGLYYLMACKGYSKEKNIWKPVLAVQYLRKLISLLDKDHPKKPTATSPLIDSAPPIPKPIVKPTAKSTTKWKQGRPANSTNKQAKKKLNLLLILSHGIFLANQVTCLLSFY